MSTGPLSWSRGRINIFHRNERHMKRGRADQCLIMQIVLQALILNCNKPVRATALGTDSEWAAMRGRCSSEGYMVWDGLPWASFHLWGSASGLQHLIAEPANVSGWQLSAAGSRRGRSLQCCYLKLFRSNSGSAWLAWCGCRKTFVSSAFLAAVAEDSD